MNGNFFVGMALGAIAGMVVLENKGKAKQMMQKFQKAAGQIKNEMTGPQSEAQNQ